MEERKRKELESIAISKIHWGEPEASVRTWLRVQGIVGDEADPILRRALIERSASVRKRAFVGLVLTGIGIAIGVANLQGANFRLQIYASMILVVSVPPFLRYLLRLLRGGMIGAVDE